MYGRLARCLPVALLLPVYVAGCTSGDDSEYRAYTPADDQYTSTIPEDGRSDAQPEAEPFLDAASAQETDGDVAQATADATDVPDDQTATTTDAAVSTTDAAAYESTLRNAALTPEQQAELLAIASAEPGSVAPLEPRETKLLVPEKSFKVEGPKQALRVVYDDLDLLKVLNMEPVTLDAPDHFPSWLRNLEGQRIRLRGFMRPGPVSEEIPMFVLARDTNACCFGPNTKAYDIIPVILQEGTTTDYIHLRPFDIVGIFHIMVEPDLDDPNKVQFIYRIDDAELIEK
jgi:hypothetical protein